MSIEIDLKDLVDLPRETTNVELKAWIDLSDKIVQAKIAKHIAALCNSGGGYLVFGFNDDLTRAPNPPKDLSRFSRDVFGSIVNKYLDPVIQCEVVYVSSSDGVSFPIVRVPSHGSTPLCSKAGGPQDQNGKTQGIQAGNY